MNRAEQMEFHRLTAAMAEANRRYRSARTYDEAERHAHAWLRLYDALDALGRGPEWRSRHRSWRMRRPGKRPFVAKRQVLQAAGERTKVRRNVLSGVRDFLARLARRAS